MCDEDTVADNNEYLDKIGDVTRRSFAVISAAALSACATSEENAAQGVVENDVEIRTPDGVADCYFVHPAKGRYPAVLVWPDIVGLRPAFRKMGKRLAESGYSVLVVNPFYRAAKAPVLPEGASFQDPANRAKLLPLAQSLTADTTKTDAVAFINWLDDQRCVDKLRKIGTTGYCMGGPMTLRTAAAVPHRVGAGGSFHGGNLVTTQPNSPHLLIPQTKAAYLYAIAQNDDASQPGAKDVLRDAYAKAGLSAEIEVYPAMHGWCALDSAVYNHDQAEKAWSRLLALLQKSL